MSKITFVNDNGKTILYYQCTDGRLKYYTRLPATQTKGTRIVLNRITDHIEELVERYRISGEPLTRAVLRAELDIVTGKTRKAGEDMFSLMSALIDKMESGALLVEKTKKKYSPGSIKTFRFTVDFLKKFDPGMTAASVTIDTYNRFIVWCQAQKYSTNYIGSQIKNWKSLGRKISNNPVFSDRNFKKIQEDSFNISLDEQELTDLWELKLSGVRDLARDWFITDSYLGLRVSDIKLLNDRNIGKKFITIANEKTDFKVVIPIHPRVRKILTKYKGFPPFMSDIAINKLIKPIARQAGINDDVLYTITKGGVREDHYLKKWEMVSTHTARRNFITNLRKNGVPDSVVMKLTGIKSIQTLQRYDKLSADEAAKIAAELDFFK